MIYQRRIQTILDQEKITSIHARHVEALMRMEHPTLDALAPKTFDTLVSVAILALYHMTTDEREDLARSFGL